MNQPAPGSHDAVARVLRRPDLADRLKRDRSAYMEEAADPTADTAAKRLARVALRQAGWGQPACEVEVAHPRLAEAVAAAADATDEQQAFDAAAAILESSEALEAFGLKTP